MEGIFYNINASSFDLIFFSLPYEPQFTWLKITQNMQSSFSIKTA